jgi:hypothetical protein
VSLGTGTTKNSDYEDILALRHILIRAIRRQTGSRRVILRNQRDGRIYAKLYNVTDKHDVWFSGYSPKGRTGGKGSDHAFDRGNKLYRVMMKSTMKHDAWLDNARIKIITN